MGGLDIEKGMADTGGVMFAVGVGVCVTCPVGVGDGTKSTVKVRLQIS